MFKIYYDCTGTLFSFYTTHNMAYVWLIQALVHGQTVCMYNNIIICTGPAGRKLIKFVGGRYWNAVSLLVRDIATLLSRSESIDSST